MTNTPKNFVLQLGSLISLYVSITALIMLAFGVINVTYPDAAEGAWQYESAASSIRFGIALLIVFFPTYVALTRLVNTIRRKEQGVYLTLTKWLIYLSLVIGGASLLGDLVALILGFLEGDLTTRFLLKALVFLIVVGTAFTYYVLDVRGYWERNESASVWYAGAVSIAVLIALVSGFQHVDPPSVVREQRLDEQQIVDLRDIQYRISEYYIINGSLPTSINMLYEGIESPAAPEGRANYEYDLTAPDQFTLCAEFGAPTQVVDRSVSRPIVETGAIIKNPEMWDHGIGRWCFDRFLGGTSTKP
jgi:hypothetical protein